MKIGAFDVRGAERGNTVSNWPFAFSFRHACQESFPLPSAPKLLIKRRGGEKRRPSRSFGFDFSRVCGGGDRGGGGKSCVVLPTVDRRFQRGKMQIRTLKCM